MTDTAKLIPLLMDVASRAIEADDLELDAFTRKEDLRKAYFCFKGERGVDHVQRDSALWAEMLQATKAEYEAAEDAKRKAYNAKRRMQSAIHRYRQALMAELNARPRAA